jgi:DNA-binding transcriptional MerR regulator
MGIKFGNKTYLTVGDVAKLMGVNFQTIKRWDRLGKLKAKRHPINGYRLYEVGSVKNLLNKLK